MYLKKIIANGFKSFADKTEIIVEDGMTAIVGPNGSGKSNISDSIKWVLGEQSPKSLRGTKMEDVIFAGTQKRLPLGYADVELIFDNTRGKKLSVEYKDVSVKRRLYRTGESEYSINGKSCRLKDIKELFMDTGIGKDGYSVIGQGKVEEILSPNSQIRRGVFEEAAGIVKFKVRKDEALRKIAKTDDNIDRVDDIILELKDRVKPLENQSKKANKYLQLKEELKLVELNMFVREYEKNNEALSLLKEQKSSIDEEKNTRVAKRNRLEGLIKEEKGSLDLLKTNIDYLTEEKSKLENNRNAAENMINVYNEKINLHTSNLSNIEEEIKDLQLNTKNIEKEKENYLAEKSEKNNDLEKIEEDYKKFNMEVVDFKIRLEASDSASEEKKNNLLNLHTKLSEVNSNLNSTESINENFKNRLVDLGSEIEDEKSSCSKFSEELKQYEYDYEDSNKQIDYLKKVKEDNIVNHENLLQDKREIQNRKQQYLNELSNLKSKKKFLDGLENDYEGYYRSVQTLMSKYKNEGKFKGSIFGTVADIIKTEEKYERAIEIALGGAIQNVIVNSNQDASFIINYLKENKIGRVTFLPITSVTERSLRNNEYQYLDELGVIGTADELIENDALFDPVVKNLLGRTIIVEDIKDGFRVAKRSNNSIKIVSLDGDIINPGGAVTGGHIKAKNHGLLSRKREIEEITNKHDLMSRKCTDVEEDIKNIERELASSQRTVNNSSKELDEFNKLLLQLENAIVLKKQEIQKSDIVVEKYERDYEFLKSENEIRDNKLLELADDKIHIEKNISDLRLEINDIKASTDSEKIKLDDMNQKLAEKTDIMNQINQDIRILFEKISQCDRKVSENNILLNKKSENLNISDSEIENAKKEVKNLELKFEDLVKELAIYNDKYANYNSDLIEKEKYVDETQKHLNELNIKLSESTDDEYDLRLKIERISSKLESLTSKIWEDYEMNYAMSLEYKNEELSLSRVTKDVNQYKKDIKLLGDINIASIEEYKEVKKRYDFLLKQKEDLENAKEQLNQVIETLEHDMEIMFIDEFRKIRSEFQTVFSNLFNGGNADVFLVDENDVLNSDIEIEAQPPGKKFTKISLLSGGEKSLTAIALLFSILKTKPTSFCILDEIDSALDDVNVNRFARYLQEFAMHTQFLCISHRKGTMESADTLYGTTMEEKGVTKLVSLKLSDLKRENKFVS